MISIIVPTYKDAPYLARAIESVRAQSRADWELIIVDDGLTPAARAVVAHYTQSDLRIICIQNDHNLGIQKSLNRALKIAQGEYIARIDDDDEWTDKDKLAKQIMYLEQHPDCVLVGTNAVIVDEQGNAIGTYRLTETNTAIRSRILSKIVFFTQPYLLAKMPSKKLEGILKQQTHSISKTTHYGSSLVLSVLLQTYLT
jgi:glycosyltransferase involved in cell wall biosynthesis